MFLIKSGNEGHEAMLKCNCGTASHHLFISRFSDDIDDNEAEWFISTCVAPKDSFWERLKWAWRYAFRPHTINPYQYNEMCLSEQDMIELSDFILHKQQQTAES